MATTFVKHPFSLYDFMGYLIPGIYTSCIFLISDYFKIYSKGNYSRSIVSLSHFDFFLKQDHLSHFVSIISLYIIFAFIFGHLISIMSNVILEELPYIDSRRRNFDILLGKRKKEQRIGFYILPAEWKKLESLDPRDKAFAISKTFTNMCFWLFPIHGFLFLAALLFSPTREKNDINKKLSIFDNFFRMQSFSDTATKLALYRIVDIIFYNYKSKFYEGNVKSYFHYIYHFVLEKCESHVPKINNYVSLYGFMRNMLMGNMILFFQWVYIYIYEMKRENFFIIILIGFGNVLYLYGYMKFIRRYTEEILFAACYTSTLITEQKNVLFPCEKNSPN